MSLQIRITHALGGQVLDLPDRPSDQPVVIGRAGGVDVQIPSASVSPRHLTLFVHDGYWFAQDTAGEGTTFVNGQPIGEPTALQVGDVIHAGTGAGAATIEVAPTAAAAGQTGYAVARVAQAPAGLPAAAVRTSGGRPRAASAAPRVPPRHMREAGAAPVPAGYVPSAGYGQAVAAEAHDYNQAGYGDPAAYAAPNDDYAAMAQASAAPTSSYASRRPRKSNNSGMIIGTVVATVLIIGGAATAIILIQKSREQPPEPPPVQKQEPKKEPEKRKSLFQ